MNVKLLTAMARRIEDEGGERFETFSDGDIVEMTDAEAERYIDAGLAVAIDDAAPKAVKPKGKADAAPKADEAPVAKEGADDVRTSA